MEQNVRVSVIVPVYKVEEFLPKCVDSILNQTWRDLEVILVDDGSPDGSGALCDEYAEKDSRVRVIHKRNGGLSSARNAGIDVAVGDFLSFVDSDDWIEPDMIESMLAAADRYGVRLVCAGRYDVDGVTGSREVGLCPIKDEAVSGVELVRRIFRWDHLDSAAWDKLYGRELFREIRYPIGRVVEDVPTTYRIALNAGRAGLISKPVYNYLHRENSITTAAVSDKTFHFFQHASRVYEDICENVPELIPDAKHLLVRAEIFNVLTIATSDKESQERYAQEYWDSRNALKKHLGFILKSPLFTRRQKVENVLLAFGMYRFFQKVYHLLKRR